MTSFTRRTLLTGLGAAGAGGLLTGCGLGGGGQTPQQGQTSGGSITVWFPGSDTAEIDLVTNTIVPAFTAATGTQVEASFTDWANLSPKLNAAFAAGTAPDVFGHGTAAVADFAVNERIVDLGPFVDRLDPGDRDDLDASLRASQVDGTQYMMPLNSSGQLIVYRGDHFSEAGLDPENPPTTWEEVRAAAEGLTQRSGGRITRAGLAATTSPIGLQQVFAVLLAAAGGRQLSEDGSTVAFNSPEGRAALQYIVDLYAGPDAVATGLGTDVNGLPPGQQPLATGSASMQLVTAATASRLVEATDPAAELRAMPALTLAGASTPGSFGGPSGGLMINADSPNQELGWSFISFMLQPEQISTYTEGVGGVPIRASALDSDYVRSNPMIQVWLEQADYWQPNPNVPGWTQIRDTLAKHFEQAANTVVDVPTALANAANEVSGMLTRQPG